MMWTSISPDMILMLTHKANKGKYVLKVTDSKLILQSVNKTDL